MQTHRSYRVTGNWRNRQRTYGAKQCKIFDPKVLITIYLYIIMILLNLIQTKDEFARRTASFDPVISSCFQHIFWSFLSLNDIEWSKEPSSLLPGTVYIVLHQIYKVQISVINQRQRLELKSGYTEKTYCPLFIMINRQSEWICESIKRKLIDPIHLFEKCLVIS